MQTSDRWSAGPLDILILLPRWNTGGVARTAWLLSDGLALGGSKVGLAMLRPSKSGAVMPPTDAQTWLLGSSISGLLGWLAPLVLFLRLLRRERPGVLFSPGNHANLLTSLCHLFAAPATRLVIKITNPIEGPSHGPWRRWVRRNAYRLMLQRASSVLALSDEDAEVIARLSPSTAHKVRVTANPYLAAPVAVGHAPSPGEGPPLILSVGRLTAQKNQALLLHALAAIVDQPWRLVILGEGGQKAVLQALCVSLGLQDRVEFAGYVADTQAYYRRAKIMALTSRWEGLPAAALEALSMGCAIVTTDCSPALARIVTESRRGCVAEQTPSAVAQAISEALAWPVFHDAPSAVAPYTIERGVEAHRLAFQAVAPSAYAPGLPASPLIAEAPGV